MRFAVIGLNGRGRELRRALALVDKASVTALCDVDERILAREVTDTKAAGFDPFATKDLRRVLERKDVDALLIATPNHWHALAGLWGLQAGKHVYVEKPVSHSVWEGEQLALASTRLGPIAAAGTSAEQGAECSNALLTSHGRPISLATLCRSRRVMSIATA